MTGFDSKRKIAQDRLDDDDVQVYAQPAQPAVDLQFLKQVLSVAIAGLYEHYKQDVVSTFSLDELSEVVDLSEGLQPQRVEDIYKRAWEMLATPPASQPAQEPRNFCPRCGKRTNDIHTCTPPRGLEMT